MTLDATSDRDDAIAEIKATLGWRFDDSGALGRRFIQAADLYILLTPKNSLTSQRADTRFQTEYDLEQIATMRDQALEFVSAIDARTASTAVSRANLPRQISLERVGDFI